MGEEPEWGIRRDDKGIHSLGRLEDGERGRVVVRERYAGHTGEPTLVISAGRSSAYGERTSGCTARPGFPGSPT